MSKKDKEEAAILILSHRHLDPFLTLGRSTIHKQCVQYSVTCSEMTPQGIPYDDPAGQRYASAAANEKPDEKVQVTTAD